VCHESDKKNQYVIRNYGIDDERRSLDIALQEEVSNQLEWL
jgi:hypothetical protein